MRLQSVRVRAGRVVAVILIAATTVGLIASGIRVWMVLRADQLALQRLAAALGPHRITRARLTGGFSYVPCKAGEPNDTLVTTLLCEQAALGSSPGTRALREFAGQMRGPSVGTTASIRHHVAGSWAVIWRDVDAAVDELRSAARLDSGNAMVQSDLAVALLERAQLKQDPLSIVEAYAAAERALALDPRLREARFNRAVILESLYLRNEAIDAWSSYLALDGRSAWATEARARLTQLNVSLPSWSVMQSRLQVAVTTGNDSAVRDIVRRFPWRVRDQVRDALTDWAAIHARGAGGADSVLRYAGALAGALRRTTNDAFWDDVSREIIDASTTRNRIRVDAMVRGLREFTDGRAFFESSARDSTALDSAKHRLQAARRSFLIGSSAAVHLVDYELARVAYQRQSQLGTDEALRRFNRVLSTTPERYRSIRALATRNVGFIETIRFRFDVAVAGYTSAIREGAVVGEPSLELRARADAARPIADVRGERAAWQQLYAGFRASPRYPDAKTDAQRLFTRAADLSSRRFPSVASLFQAESVRLARSVGQPLLVATALTRDAELFARTGRSSQALQSLGEVRAHLARIRNDSIRAEMSGDADLVEGEALLHVRPNSAIALLKRVVDRYRATNYLIQVVRANLLLANAYTAAGAMDSARRAFELAIAEREEQRSELGSFEDRARFLDQARPVIDSLTLFLIDRGDTLGAFDFFERMRSRVLLEQVNRQTPTTNDSLAGSLAVVRRELPRRTNVVSYAVLDDELVTWLIRSDGISMVRARLDGQLEELVNRFTLLIAAPSQEGEIRSVAGRLYQLLIAPLEGKIEPQSRLVIVPDKWIHYVPFAALFDDRRKQFLVESHEINVAPSIRLFMESTRRYHALRETAAPTVLAVGNPSFDPQSYTLPSLRGAEQEAARVAQQYANTRILIGPDATKLAFLRAAPTSNIIHFAGHGVVRPDAPLLSELVLARDSAEQSSGALYAKDLYQIRLPRTSLAILSGCHTATGELSPTEGASSLARAFFATGVPAVVASLWAVDDDQTAVFFESFHRALARGVDPTVALRRVQIEWITHRSQADRWQTLATWAAFQLFGASGDGPASDANGFTARQD